MSKESFAGIRKATDKATILWKLLLQEVRERKNWAVRLLVVDALFLVLLNPLFLTRVVSQVGVGPLPEGYAPAFWLGFAALFAAALIAAWHKSITFWLFAVGLVGATVIVVLSTRFDESTSSAVQARFVSTIFTLFVIVFVGGGVAVLRQWSDRQREAREREKREQQERRAQDRELLLNTHHQLLSAYNKAKRVRRILRARVLRPENERAPVDAQVILASDYDHYMETLIDAQLELETIERRNQGNVELFGRVPGLEEALAEIRRYLYDTVEEYEEVRTEFEGDPPSLSLAKLPELSGFMGSGGGDQEYREEFRTPFQDALMSLRLAVQAHGTEQLSERPVEPPSRASTLGLGMRLNAVKLRPHSPRWSHRFQQECDRLTKAIGDLAHSIEHVGSTAVGEVWALPVIDMLVVVSSLDERRREQLSSVLAQCGYEQLPHPAGGEQLLYFRRSLSDVWTHSVWVAEKDSDYSQASVRLREYLRTHPDARSHYSSEKRRLAKKHSRDPLAYRQAKTELIAQLDQKVERWPEPPT